MKSIVIDDICTKSIKEIIYEFAKGYLDIYLRNCQENLLTYLKIKSYRFVQTDLYGRIHIIDKDFSYTLDIKNEVVYAFHNKVLITKQLMSLKLLRYSAKLWNDTNDNFNLDNNTHNEIMYNTSLKYLIKLSVIGINTKNIFT